MAAGVGITAMARSVSADRYAVRYFFAWLKYFKSGAACPFFDGMSRPSALRK